LLFSLKKFVALKRRALQSLKFVSALKGGIMYLTTRLLTAYLFIGLLLSTSGLSQSESSNNKSPALSAPDEAAVKAVVTEFFNLYPKKDSAAVSRLWSEKSPYLAAHKKELERIFAAAGQIDAKNVAFGMISVEGENVKIRVDA
jgi:hypothetical protein